MAVIWANGFEVGDLNYYNNWPTSSGVLSGITSISGPFANTITVLNDCIHRRADGSGGKFSAFSSGGISVLNLPATPRWVQGWFRPRGDSGPGSVSIGFDTAAGASQCSVIFDRTDNKIRILRSATVLATSAGTFSPTSAYWFAIEVVVDNTVGLVKVYLNDDVSTFVAVTAADTQLQTASEFLGVRFGVANTSRSFWDDLIITDVTTGRVAQCYAVLGRPVSNQSVAFTPSAGDNWQNARPVMNAGTMNPDAVTRYNEAGAAGQDLYNVALDSKLNPAGAVACVVTHVIATGTGNLLGQTLLKSGATTGNTASYGIPRDGASYGPRIDYWLTDPNTGVAWTPAAFNVGNLAVGLKTL